MGIFIHIYLVLCCHGKNNVNPNIKRLIPGNQYYWKTPFHNIKHQCLAWCSFFKCRMTMVHTSFSVPRHVLPSILPKVKKLFPSIRNKCLTLNPMVASGNSVGRLPDYFALFVEIRFQCSDTPVESKDMKKHSTNYIFSRGK